MSTGSLPIAAPVVESLLGYKPEELIDSTPERLLFDDDLAEEKQHFAKRKQSPGGNTESRVPAAA